MKPLEIVLAFGVLCVLLALSFGSGAYWQSKRTALPDTVRVVQYVPQASVSDTAKPIRKPQRAKPIVRSVAKPDTLDGGTYATDSVTIAKADYDSLTIPRYWSIEGENIGYLELSYDPLSAVLLYTHDPPPLKVETVEVTKELPVSFLKKMEYVGYGVAGGIILTLLLHR